MTTEAGKHWAESPDWWLIEGEREQARECIAAIEAEAVAAERERIAEEVRGIPEGCIYRNCDCLVGDTCGHADIVHIDRAAVLAIVKSEP